MTDTRVDLYLEWEQALNEPEVDIALVASLETQARTMGLDLWKINNFMLNSMSVKSSDLPSPEEMATLSPEAAELVRGLTAAMPWNEQLHPRGWHGQFIEVGDFVEVFGRARRHPGGRGRVRHIKSDGKLVVEIDRDPNGSPVQTRVVTVDPAGVRPIGVKAEIAKPRRSLTEVGNDFLDRAAQIYGEAPIPDWIMRWYESLMRTAIPKEMRGPRLYPRTAAVTFDPELHPRGRDGKFIESFGLVRLFDFMDRKGNRHSEGFGKVTDITRDPRSPGNPDIEVELPEGGHVTVKPNQVSSAPDVKGRINRDLTDIEAAEEITDIEAAERLIAERPVERPGEVDVEEDIEFADTIYNTSRDVGNLQVGDEIILPGDIPGTIVEFEFPGDRPDSVRVHTDGGTYHGRTTDVLPNFRPGEEVNPIGEPVMEKPGEAGSKTNPIKTSDPLEAVKALRDGKHVELESVDQVSTLLNELADIANEAKAAGEEAPNYDLCLVSVPGTNLFCAESKGIPRIEMPQLSGFPVPGSKADDLPRTEEGGVDIGPAFMDHLRSQGVGVTEERRLASHLKASQSELIGSKIAGMMRAMDSGNEFAIRNIRENPIFVTSDGYVIDGHHRWASVVGWDALEGGLDDYDMPVRVIDMDIMEVLSEANKFANDFGIPQVSSSDVGPEIKQVNLPSAPSAPATDRPFENLSDAELQRTYANTVDRLVGDIDDPQLIESLGLDVEYIRDEFEARGLSRREGGDRPFRNLSDDELQDAYQRTVNQLIEDFDDPQLMDSLELDVKYFREELESRGLSRQTDSESFRQRNVDLDLAELRRRAYGDAAMATESTRAAEMNRRE